MFKKFKNILSTLLLLSLILTGPVIYAESDDSERYQEKVRVLNTALSAAKEGPTTITLIDQATLNIPANYLYIPTKEAADFMHVIGNETNENFVGIILSKTDDLRWIITIDFIKSGYIRDDDTKSWNENDLLQNLKDGTEASNEARAEEGFPPLHVTGWIEKPTYDSSEHHLVWSLLAKSEGSTESTVNYNTYALGREGYFEFNLITSESAIALNKDHAKEILAALHFNNGKRYEEFVEGQDNVAKYGIAALITGIAAKKLGLLALAAAFLIKIWKLLILVPLLLGAKIKSLFSRFKKSA